MAVILIICGAHMTIGKRRAVGYYGAPIKERLNEFYDEHDACAAAQGYIPDPFVLEYEIGPEFIPEKLIDERRYSDLPDKAIPRGENVKCIATGHVDHPGKAWCGRYIGMEFHFQDAGHAALNGLAGGPLTTCPGCAAAVTLAMQGARRHKPAHKVN